MSKGLHSKYDSQVSVTIRGDIAYNNISQLFSSNLFKDLLISFIRKLEVKKAPVLSVLKGFRIETEESGYDVKKIINLFYMLNLNKISYLYEEGILDVEEDKREEFSRFMLELAEKFYNYWRSLQRFMIRQETYSSVEQRRRSKGYSLARTNDDLKKLVLDTYRNITINIEHVPPKIYRQLPSGAQAAFLVDSFEIPSNLKFKNESLYNVPYVWEGIFEPPVIFYTRSNKRKGVFPVKDKDFLQSFYLDNTEWFVFPTMVGELLEMIYVHKDYLSLAAGLANLYELASPEIYQNRKPDGFVIFGLDEKLFEEDEMRGVVVKEGDQYFGLLPRTSEIDYFGYMKKMALTIHNLIQIDRGCMPVHGALAKIELPNGKSANIMLMGDSGAGKSETLEAINKLPETATSSVEMLIDDMGSLHIDETGTVYAQGTETGAFVRLDDLQPGYAYAAMDRSIFMNPNIINARVIVPLMPYADIIKHVPIDYLFYVNNYEEVGDGTDIISFFEDYDSSYAVFSEGKRMAKGTTGEKGLTTSYFANPFGAIQRMDDHEVIAKNFFDKMYKNGIKIGMIKTRLGLEGYEQDGPLAAAEKLIEMIASK
jgi:energy-coupling factor transporter ATP-binding protein EcfA2